ncbi:MAG TPA: lipoate--protein ligase family protein [Bacteroidota bacterium]
MNWSFEHSGFNTGAFNMQYDERLAREVAAGMRPSTVRVYGWNPPAISLGRHQPLEEIDVDAAKKAGIDVVRRPTGGRAILHSDELTYCVVMPAVGRSVAAVYQEISEALLCGLQRLGMTAALEKLQPHFPSLYQSTSGAACFSSSARYEIKVDGRKLVGSAQRRFYFHETEVVLQHGSLLMGQDHLRISDFLNVDHESARAMLRNELREKTTDLKSILGVPVLFDDVAGAIRNGFEEALGIAFESLMTSNTRSTILS